MMGAPLLLDALGVTFDRYLELLPANRWQWPKPCPRRDQEVLRRWHHLRQCQMCGQMGTTIHHIFGGLFGGAGRSDEPCALIALCDGFGGCHDWVQGDRNRLAAVLFAKWTADQASTDWVRMAVLYALPLPRPEPDRPRFTAFLEVTTPPWKKEN